MKKVAVNYCMSLEFLFGVTVPSSIGLK